MTTKLAIKDADNVRGTNWLTCHIGHLVPLLQGKRHDPVDATEGLYTLSVAPPLFPQSSYDALSEYAIKPHTSSTCVGPHDLLISRGFGSVEGPLILDDLRTRISYL